MNRPPETTNRKPETGNGKPETGNRKRDAGVILILVLWIAAALTLFMFAMVRGAGVDRQISLGAADRLKALEAARSGVDAALAELAADDSGADGPWDLWHDDPDRFLAAAIPDPGGDDEPFARFTVFAGKGYVDTIPFRYGPQDESGKINLNTASREMLLALSPRMTPEIADAVLDWRDGDDKPGASGAEDSYYLSLTPPYHCKNAPFESVEELLYVRGVDAMLLYGEDWNRNGVLDPGEQDGDATDPPDNGDTELEPGLWPLCTVYTYDLNVTNEGKPRVNVNKAGDKDLQSALGRVLTAAQLKAIVTGRGRGPYRSVADLLNLPGWDVTAFQAAADLVTVSGEERLFGLVNVNTAPREVLQALPGMTPDLADAVVAARDRAEAPLTNIGWLLSAVGKAPFQKLANFVTVRAHQFAIQSVGWIPSRRGLPPIYARVWAVYDVAEGAPVLRAWKDLTSLGFPYALEETAD